MRDETKYGRMLAFARALPRIRRRVRQHLALSGLPRDSAARAACGTSSL
jgi:DNA topoisomerase-1